MKIKEPKNKLIFTAVYIGFLIIFWAFKLPCIYDYFFGIPCPGCGMSHAYFSLLKLDFAAAFSYHPMFWSVPILYLYLWFDGRLIGKKRLDYSVLILIAIGFIANWIIKLFA